MQTSKPFYIVGLSGGVDSSATALLLLEKGARVEGIFMKNWVDVHGDENCTAMDDMDDARQVAEKLDIPFDTVNFAPEYWDRVFTHFLDEYRAGRTPNPDILCNREIKFDLFLKLALEKGADKIATGHYARVTEENGLFQLRKAREQSKDQTYFLYTLGQAQLKHSLFPLGDIEHKKTVREMAETAKLVTHDKKDSTGICFIGEKNFTEFLGHYLPAQPGNIVTSDNQTIGQHQGLMYYTLGQRKGLGIGGSSNASELPWFVVGKRLAENELVVAQGTNHPLLLSTELLAEQLHWVSGKAPKSGSKLKAKTRYRQPDQDCTIEFNDTRTVRVNFDEQQRAVTPGQSVVFYDGEICLGGGIIQSVDGIIYG